jgi:hypothetical protein
VYPDDKEVWKGKVRMDGSRRREVEIFSETESEGEDEIPAVRPGG